VCSSPATLKPDLARNRNQVAEGGEGGGRIVRRGKTWERPGKLSAPVLSQEWRTLLRTRKTEEEGSRDSRKPCNIPSAAEDLPNL